MHDFNFHNNSVHAHRFSFFSSGKRVYEDKYLVVANSKYRYKHRFTDFNSPALY